MGKLKDLSCTMASTQQLVLILALQAVSASCSSMCDTCTSFLESADRLMMPTVRDALVQPKGDCQKACLKMQTGKDMISCAVLCEHTGTDTFASLLEISDYVDATEICSSHQVCARKEVPDSAIALLETAAMTGQNASKAKPGNVTINGDMGITGALKTKSIRSSALTVNGSITVTHAVRTEFLKADNTKSSVVETSTVSSPTGSVTLTGNLAMQNTVAGGASLSAAFIETDNLIQHGVKQWKLVAHDDFETEAKDWVSHEGSAFIQTSSCSAGDKFLGGHCNMAGGHLKKSFGDLPEHTHLRVQARYHMLDSWEGETAFLKMDNQYAWTDSNDASAKRGINICGGEHPEAKFSAPIDVIIPHSDASVMLEFGSTLDEHACDESFGIDDVMVSVK